MNQELPAVKEDKSEDKTKGTTDQEHKLPRAPVGRSFTLSEVCDELNLGPHTVRQLLDDFEELIEVQVVEGNKKLSESDLARLRTINDLRMQGFDTETIIEEVKGQGDLTTDSEQLPSTRELLAEIFNRLDALDERTRLLEERLVDDRDKFMLNVLKLKKEIQHLRYELASNKSRRDRKKGLFK